MIGNETNWRCSTIWYDAIRCEKV